MTSAAEQGMFISFVLPTKNSIPHLRSALEGVARQGYEPYEVVIQDGGSTDGTLEYLASLASTDLGYRVRVRSEPDSGIGQAYNRGLQRAEGDLIWFLATDEVLRPNAVQRAVSWYQRFPNAATIYSGVDLIDEQGGLLKRFLPPPFELLRFMQCAVFPTPSGFLNRRVIDDDLYYDESLRTCPDYDFWIRIGSRFGPEQLVAVSEVWTAALGTRTSMSFRSEAFDQFCQDKLGILGRHVDRESPDPIIRALWKTSAAGIYCWAAESVHDLTGLTPQFLAYLKEAAALDAGSPRLSYLARHTVGAAVNAQTGEVQIDASQQLARPASAKENWTVEQLGFDIFETYPHWKGAQIVRHKDRVEIHTVKDIWAYSAQFPFELDGPNPKKWLWMRVKMRVTVGKIGVAVLCAQKGSNDELVDEQFFAGGVHDAFIKVDASRYRTIAGLMIRNISPEGASIVEIEDASLVSAGRDAEEVAVRELVYRQAGRRSYAL